MKKFIFIITLLYTVSIAGCSAIAPPAPKPNATGPTGMAKDSTPRPPVMQSFKNAPAGLYDLEQISGITFEHINKENWDAAQQTLYNLSQTWQEVKPLVAEKKGVKEADEAYTKLTEAITQKQVINSYKQLNSFMGSISDIAKSYKLSPLSNIIAISNSMRNVAFYIEDNNWSKAASKVKELENSWEQLKPGLEQVGILGEITKTHSLVKQLKDAVNAENKSACDEHLADLNRSMSNIRDFYKGR